MFKNKRLLIQFLLALLLLSSLFLALLKSGRLQIRETSQYSIPEMSLYSRAKDFDFEDHRIVSTSDDPWLEIQVPRGRYCAIELDVSYLSQSSTPCTVYYGLSDRGGYTEGQSASGTLQEGLVRIELPYTTIDSIRLDLTGEPNVTIGLGTVQLIGFNGPISLKKTVLAVGTALLAPLVFIALFILLAGISDVKITWTEKGFLLLCFCIYLFWALAFTTWSYGPDEYMRYDVPLYIYTNGVLPTGPEESIRNEIWGISYGFDISLPYILSALFMHVMTLFTVNSRALLIAARLVSVLSTVGTAYFAILLSKKLFGDNPIRWVFIALISLLPQIVFLSSYVNLDTFSLFTVMVILYSWVVCLERDWDAPSSAMLSIGLGLCFLSYQFAYGFILGTFLLYVAWHLVYFKKRSFKAFMATGIMILVVVFAICGWKFIRNGVLYGGDIFARRASRPYAEMYAMEAYKPSVKKSVAESGLSLLYMLRSMRWIETTMDSLVGVFGYMNVAMPAAYYFLFRWLFILGLAGSVLNVAGSLRRRAGAGRLRQMGLVAGGLLLSSAVTLILSIYYSYTQDYQAQGRYVLTIVPLMSLIIAVGLDYFTRLFSMRLMKHERLCRALEARWSACVFCFLLVSMFYGFYICTCAFI